MLQDGHFVVNGQKIWTSSAHYADMMFLLCRTEPDKPKHDGISYLLLSMQTPGIEVRPLRTMTGRAEFNEVFFTDVRVPEDQIVLGRGKGWYVANVTLKHERSMIGNAEKMTTRLEQLITLLKASGLLGMAEYRDRLLKLQGEVMAWKAHNLRLLTEAAQGVDSGVKRMIIKYGGTMLGFRLASLAVDALGTAGLAFESAGEDAEDDDATTWNIDYLYDVGPDDRWRVQQHPEEHHCGTRPRPAARAEGGEGLMEFALSEEQRLFADSLRGLLADRVTIDALRRHADAGSGFDADLWDSLAELGLPGLLVPERFGGAGLGVLDAAVAAEVLGGAAAFAPFAGSIVMATLAFIHGATEALQEAWLPRIAAGEVRFGVGFSRTATRHAAIDAGSPTHLLMYRPDGHAAFVAAEHAIDAHASQHRSHASRYRSSTSTPRAPPC